MWERVEREHALEEARPARGGAAGRGVRVCPELAHAERRVREPRDAGLPGSPAPRWWRGWAAGPPLRPGVWGVRGFWSWCLVGVDLRRRGACAWQRMGGEGRGFGVDPAFHILLAGLASWAYERCMATKQKCSKQSKDECVVETSSATVPPGPKKRRGRHATTTEFTEYEWALLIACQKERGLSRVSVMRIALRDFARAAGIRVADEGK